MLVALDSSTRYAGVALYDERGVLAEANWQAGTNHTQQLLPALDRLCQEQGAAPSDFRAVAVALGPGSFNGLRVALSLAKGLCLGLGLPLLGVGTLAATAYGQRLTGLPVCALIDAGRGQLYGALFPPDEEAWPAGGSSGIANLTELLEQLPPRTLFCGELSAAGAELVGERLGAGAVILTPALSLRRAGWLAELAWRRLQRGEADDLATTQAIYVQRPLTNQARATG
ncbi:MAG: tRNA (adenosine(37)-N6)-threonylcarbamoyltransferase complex dimerization subunit type 1 TsaB [Chloroflexota bacterium]